MPPAHRPRAPRAARRSLDWCCQVELLLLVGAPQQAFERIAANFFAAIEWVEKNMLGWDIPGDEDMMPMVQNLAIYYPECHAYTFDQYKWAGGGACHTAGLLQPGAMLLQQQHAVMRRRTHAHAPTHPPSPRLPTPRRYPMTEPEKTKLKHTHALRYYERFNGRRGDVDPAEVDAIRSGGHGAGRGRARGSGRAGARR